MTITIAEPPHDFNHDLARAKESEHLFDAAYRLVFTDHLKYRVDPQLATDDHERDICLKLQLAGADVIFRDQHGKFTAIDEKWQFALGDPNGLPIELTRNMGSHAPGWALDPNHRANMIAFGYRDHDTHVVIRFYDAVKLKEIIAPLRSDLAACPRAFFKANRTADGGTYTTCGAYIDYDTVKPAFLRNISL